MASGTIYGTSKYDHTCYIYWSSTPGTGGSTVYADLKMEVKYNYSYVNRRGCSLNINGNTNSGSGTRVNQSSGTHYYTFLSHSTWVSYTGSKSISISGSIDLSEVTSSGRPMGSFSASDTVALDNVGTRPSVPVCTAPTTQTVSELGATIKIIWSKARSYTSSGAGYWVDVCVNGGAWSNVAQINNLDTLSYNYTIPAGQGGTYQFRVGAFNPVGNAGDHGYSGIITRNSLSAPAVGDIGTHNPYVNSTLTVPLSGGGQTSGGDIKRMCALYYGDTQVWEADYNAISWNNTSVSCTYGSANYAAKIGNKAYSSDNFKIVTWVENANRSKSNYATKNFTVNLNTDGGATPTFGEISLSGGAFNYPSTCFIAGVSTLIVKIPNATARRAPSGTTVSYTVYATGLTEKVGQTVSYDSLNPGIITITAVVRDSRGLETRKQTTITVQRYYPPNIKNLVVERMPNPKTNGRATYTLTYSPIYANGISGTNLNSISVQQIRKASGTWENYTSGTTITGLNTENSYKIEIRVSDKVKPEGYVIASSVIPTDRKMLAMRRTGLGVQCVPKDGYALDIGGKIRVQKELAFSVNGRDRIPLSMFAGSNDSGDGVRIGAGGAVVIGSGESADVLISGGINGYTESTWIASDTDIILVTGYNNDASGTHSKININNNGRVVFTDSRGGIDSPLTTSYLDALKGQTVINLTASGAAYKGIVSGESTNGKFSMYMHNDNFSVLYQNNTNINAGVDGYDKNVVLLNEAGNSSFNHIDATGMNINGNETITGSLNVSAIELKHATPFIDFHAQNSTSDYTTRLIALKPNQLNCTGNFTCEGSLSGTNTLSYLGTHRFDQEWIGFYRNHNDAVNDTNKAGWIGFNKGKWLNFAIQTDSGDSSAGFNFNFKTWGCFYSIDFTTYDSMVNHRTNASGGHWFNAISSPKITNSSTADLKTNIIAFENIPAESTGFYALSEPQHKKALDTVCNSTIYQYDLIDEVKKNIAFNKNYGFVVGNNAPKELYNYNPVTEKPEGINLYSMASFAWQSIKELAQQVNELQVEVNKLKGAQV